MDKLEEFNRLMYLRAAGKVRVAEKINGEWVVNTEIKETILAGFRLGTLTDMSCGEFSFIDKNTYPTRKFTTDDKVRIVPGGSTVRRGAYLAPSTVVVPPSDLWALALRSDAMYICRPPLSSEVCLSPSAPCL